MVKRKEPATSAAARSDPGSRSRTASARWPSTLEPITYLTYLRSAAMTLEPKNRRMSAFEVPSTIDRLIT